MRAKGTQYGDSAYVFCILDTKNEGIPPAGDRRDSGRDSDLRTGAATA